MAAFAVALFFGVGVAAVVRLGIRAADRPDEASCRALRRTDLVDYPAPVLVLVHDPSCPPCRHALADFEAERVRDAVGLDVIPVQRRDLGSVAASALEPGLFPVYLRFDDSGRLVDLVRGYRSPEALADWVRRDDSPAAGAFP